LNRLVGNRDRQVSFAATGLPHEDQVSALCDKVGAEVVAEQCGAHDGLLSEVEVVHGFEKWEASVMGGAAQSRAVPMSDLFGQEGG